MRTYEQRLNYEKLELIPTTQSSLQDKLGLVVSGFQKAWERLVGFFELSSEPSVYHTSDASGEWWYVYEPTTGRSFWFATEAEVLEWFDTRHYRQGRLFE
ncbi:hypothetical protein H6G89_19585 [Oscillatoria sp. FACHB-1407]|uniref:hypothetical protein n=1 Tax=Oscillatoria sp. FACHB-1407 TaxID=2692847 RepID=UPI0016835E69|nr:hypothetical protein [Oscillatoria sp. FACHB-1407]MBD2463240.1 hypothetical protein [Oscillatoria sp. FACHB-1407]